MTPNVFSYVALLVYPLIAVAVFRSMRPAVAAIVLVIAGDMFLPQDVGFDLPGLPNLVKDHFVYLSILVGVLATAPGLLSVRPGLYEASAVVLALGGAMTTYTNPDVLRYGPTVLPPMPWEDFPTGAINDLLSYLLPFFLGRALVRQGRDVGVIIAALAAGGMVYSLLCWIEIQLSPQLHVWIYGFMPSAFVMAYRWGGFRPIVLMENGLATGIFMATALIACATLARLGLPVLRLPSRPASAWLTVTLVACKSIAAMVFGAVIAGAMLVLRPRWLARIAVAMVLLFALYPTLRLAELFPVDTIGEISFAFDETRGRSLTGRFEVERLMLDKARERVWFGWGGYMRNWVFDPINGESLIVPDGYWILRLGSRGIVGFVCAFAMVVIPVIGAAARLRRVPGRRDQFLLAGVMLIIAVRVVDQIPNGRWSSQPVFLAGALYSTSRALASERERARRRQAAAESERPAEAAAGPAPPDPEGGAPPARGPRLADLLRPTTTREPGP